ncbi:MAG: hemerythrin family protein [Rhodospirillales bacterium]|nr:hemerythrin family protein [Rhodospirillales bacterium]
MPLIWRDAMNVGHKVIDDDHKRLVEIINAYEAELSNGVREEAISKILRQLYDYAQSHFIREERVQLRCAYPFHDAHKRDHQDLLRQLHDIIRKYFIDRTSEIDLAAAAELAEFLRTWLKEHIIKADLRMKPFLDAARLKGGSEVSAD